MPTTVAPCEPAAERSGDRLGVVKRVAAVATSASVPLQGLLSVLDQMIVSGTGFVTVLLIGRACTPAELGVYSLAMTIVTLMLNAQAELVLAPYTVYRQRHRGADRASYAGSVVVHQFVLAAFAAVCFFGIWFAFSLSGGSPALASVFWVLLWAGPLWLCRGFIRLFSFAGFQFLTAMIVDATVAALQLGSLLLLVQLGRLTAPLAFAVMGGSCAVACLGWLVARPHPLRFSAPRIIPDWRRNWAFGRWVLASELVGCSTPFIVPWILHYRLGAAATGLLAACVAVCGVASMFVVGISHLLTPQAARAFADEGRDGLRRVLRRTGVIYLMATGSLCLVVGVAGDQLMAVLFGAAFGATRLVCTFLALSVMVGSIGTVAGNGLWAINRPKANLVPDACTFVGTLVMALSLVGPLGVTGIAVAILFGNALGTAARCAALRQLINEVDESSLRVEHHRSAG